MKTRNFPILLALIALIAAGLACGAPAAPTVSNFYMATDEQGTNHTTVFSSTDDFFVFFDVKNVPAGTPFQSQWFALNVEGMDPSSPFHTIDYNLEDNVTTVFFQLTNSDGWPVGNYRVDIYMNGAKVGEQAFSVR
jgi:hypothetical protein